MTEMQLDAVYFDHERLEAALGEESRALVLGPVRSRLRTELAQEHRQGLAAPNEALASERYRRLLDALDTLTADLPLTPAAQQPARRVVGDLVRRAAKRMHRAVQRIAVPGFDERDQGLHEARKKAKLLRYAAELAASVGGRHTKKLAKRAKAVQQALRQHQDSVVARQQLRRLGAQSFFLGENGFTFGLLLGAERLRAERTERAFYAASDRLPRPRTAAAWVSKRWTRHTHPPPGPARAD